MGKAQNENQISDLTRREVVDLLLSRIVPFHGRLDIMEFLRRVWSLNEMPSEDERFSDAEGDIWQHVVNNHDWEHDQLLFKRLQIETCPDNIFLRFVEAALSPRVVTDMNSVEDVTSAVSQLLSRDGWNLAPDGRVSGWTVYRAEYLGNSPTLAARPTHVFPFSINDLSHTMIELLMNRGKAREVALLSLCEGHSLEQTRFDNWNGGTYYWTLTISTPTPLYARLTPDELRDAEQSLSETASELLRPYKNSRMDAVIVVPVLNSKTGIREEALHWLNGEGITNQGRVRSDNIAAREFDGLLFRSQHEINLYQALKSAGVPFAPLPVFLRGGSEYRRLEPDFVIFKDEVLLIVELDGDTVHTESPAVAAQRLRLFTDEGALTERILASQCSTAADARSCVAMLLERIERHAHRR